MLSIRQLAHIRAPIIRKCVGILKLTLRYSSVDTNQSTKTQINLNELDGKWAERWRNMSPNGSLHPSKHMVDELAEPFYCLSMFPYPSGMLHMGHLRVYTISDVIARFKRLKGYNVIHPMGWDAFGLPAENAAVERGINPAIWTDSNIQKMKEQMSLMLADFDWDREISTCSPDYYKWTQKIFLLLFEHGLAYRNEAEINWDPVDQTVLANEQVDSEGKSWRSGALVEKRNLEQWFIGITKYAKDLNEDLKVLDKWPDKVKSMQSHWIGESQGAEIKFLTNDNQFSEIQVFTTRPDTLFSAQFIALALNHPLVEKYAADDPKLAQFIKNCENSAIDSKEGYLIEDVNVSIPITVNNEKNHKYDMRVYAAPYVLGTYGHGAVMGCPAHDERDFEFWKLHNPTIAPLQLVGSLKPNKNENNVLYTNKRGILYDSSVLPNGLQDLGKYNRKSTSKAAHDIVETLERYNLGSKSIQYRIRDWLISRQRYWGAPIPIVHCDSCGPVAVPDDELPVMLPEIEGQSFGKGNPLAKLDEFVNTKCPSCGGNAKRDTDTMDTFMDSSWYFFRYTDPTNTQLPFDHAIASKHMPIDMYIGGVEHAILHLLYSRFISKFLGDIGLWDGKDHRHEPIKQLVTQGMVHGKTYTDPESERFLKPEELDLSNVNEPKIIKSGLLPNISFEKMSKSKYNGADPSECIKKYGADATRAHMLFQAPISDILNWNEEQIHGIDRWLRKVVNLNDVIAESMLNDNGRTNNDNCTEYQNIQLNDITYETIKFNETEFELYNDAQNYVESVSKAIEIDFSFNTIISDFMKFTNSIYAAIKSKDYVNSNLLLDSYKRLLIIMAPVTPCVAEECWEQISKSIRTPWSSIFFQKYPKVNHIESSYTSYNVFVNGKARALFKGQKSLVTMDEHEILQEALRHGSISQYVPDGVVKKMIVKPGMISLLTPKK